MHCSFNWVWNLVRSYSPVGIPKKTKKIAFDFARTLLLCIPSGWNSCLGETQLIKKVNQPLPSVSQQAVINAHSTEVIDHD